MSSMKKAITSSDAPKPVGPYSQAVQAGNFLFISGQIAIDSKTNQLAASDITAQTRQVLENIKVIAQTAGYSLADVIQTTVYLSSMTLFADFNREYAKYFKVDYPARATIACQLKEGVLVEVSAVAYKE
ncbi:MAG: RidA family protein [Candidatus Bathyarchaeia archaeon]